jgi:hypothetical protein
MNTETTEKKRYGKQTGKVWHSNHIQFGEWVGLVEVLAEEFQSANTDIQGEMSLLFVALHGDDPDGNRFRLGGALRVSNAFNVLKVTNGVGDQLE